MIASATTTSLPAPTRNLKDLGQNSKELTAQLTQTHFAEEDETEQEEVEKLIGKYIKNSIAHKPGLGTPLHKSSSNMAWQTKNIC